MLNEERPSNDYGTANQAGEESEGEESSIDNTYMRIMTSKPHCSSHASEKQGAELKRSLDFLDILFIGMGSSIGSSFFILLSRNLARVGHMIVFCYLFGGLVAYMTALCFIELFFKIPSSGA